MPKKFLPLSLATLAALPLLAAAFERADAPTAAASAPLSAAERAAAAPTDRLIVKYRSAARESAPSAAAQLRAEAAVQRHGVRLSHVRRLADGAHVFRLDRPLPAAQLRQIGEDLRNGNADVEYVEPDALMQPQFEPDDARYAQQWALSEATAGIRAPTAWDKSRGAGVVVAVIDTGMRPHADLLPNLLPGRDLITDTFIARDGDGRDADPADPGDWVSAGQCYGGSPARKSSWHGTHVAGIVAAVTNNGAGVAGVAFGARVLPVRVLGRCGGYTSDIADGMVWAAGGTVSGQPANATPARVLNLSLGGAGSCSRTYQNAVATARSLGAVVVVAAGNGSSDVSGSQPGNCPGVVAVAAVNRAGSRASYSNHGTAVDLAAPGGDSAAGILSTLNGGSTTPGADSYAAYMGTSMATPHVAGTAALMLARNPSLTPDEVETRLKNSARPFPGACGGCGSGLLDANAAVDAAGGAPAPVAVAEVEPNDNLASAQPLSALPALVQGTLRTSGDLDLYRVQLPAGGTLTARLTPNPEANYDLVAVDGSGARLAISQLSGAQTDTVSVRNGGSAAMSVALRVRWAAGATGAYRLGVELN
ncbi:S8 family peptidase [Azohydromonas caseinilytica]|uniref:S8 family serine peptidase n=1 Tax=Azohydromonas caseinilytica TaxID=2728836 RepID=A0A848F5M4_9BURK|nr:S8 family peptidase [Azohydromonas caseinilytica]NML13956.1 S8 family serine peptidase [Azohydromonas caseinilytica]